MNWQNYIVFGIGIAVVAILVRRLVCALRGTARRRCSSCTANCPLKRAVRKRNR